AHRITLDPNTTKPLSAIEGGPPLGTIQGAVPRILSSDQWIGAAYDNRAAAIRSIRGYSGSHLWTGDVGINSVYPFYVVPTLTAGPVQPGHDLLCLVHRGQVIEQAAFLNAEISGEWWADGTYHLTWDGETTIVPVLP